MALDRYKLDWILDTSDKWTVAHTAHKIGDDTDGVEVGHKVELAGSGTAVEVNVNISGITNPWGKGSLTPSTDVIDGATEVSKRFIKITRTPVFVCTVKTTPKETFWVACQPADIDLYQRNWQLLNRWAVISSNVSSVTKGDILTFPYPVAEVRLKTATDPVRVWGETCSYAADLDEISGKVRGSGIGFTIKRRIGLHCQLDNSGGNSWTAVEGG